MASSVSVTANSEVGEMGMVSAPPMGSALMPGWAMVGMESASMVTVTPFAARNGAMESRNRLPTGLVCRFTLVSLDRAVLRTMTASAARLPDAVSALESRTL